MAHGKSDSEMIKKTHNTARFFVEVRQISWVLLIGVMLWGFFAYFSMPQRKDPEIAVRQAVAITPWPGASAEKIEQLVTKKIEEQMAANAVVTKIVARAKIKALVAASGSRAQIVEEMARLEGVLLPFSPFERAAGTPGWAIDDVLARLTCGREPWANAA